MNYFWGCLGIVIIAALAITYWPIFIGIISLIGLYYLIRYFISAKNNNTDVDKNDEQVLNNTNEYKSELPDQKTYTKFEHKETIMSDDNNKGPKLNCGLYYGEIILLDWLNGSKQNAKIPSSIVSFYSINPLKATYELIEKGLIKNGPISSGLNSLKATQLKDILRENNAKVSGKKEELIDRIIKNNYTESINFEIPKTYVVSDEGKEILDKYGIFPWAKKQNGFLRPIDYVPYAESQPPYEKIKIKICKNRIDSIVNTGGAEYPYRFLFIFESEIADCLDKLDDKRAIKHFIYSSVLNYFSFSPVTGIGPSFEVPQEWDSADLQNTVIKYFQGCPIEKEEIFNIVNNFISDYKGKIPNFLIKNTTVLTKIITEAIALDPTNYHQKRIEFINNKIPKKMFFI